MASYFFGKKFVTKYLKEKFPQNSTCLDIGPCNGKWFKLLGNHFIIDAVEAWEPNIEKYKLADKYRKITHADVLDFDEFNYDVIVMGDVLEHLSVEDGQKVIEKMYPRCKELMVAVPYRLRQHALHGNPFEVHKQPDLTKKIFTERYPGFKLLWSNFLYGYYIKDPEYKQKTKAKK